MRIYSGIYSSYSAPGSRIPGMEIQVFRNRKSSQTNAILGNPGLQRGWEGKGETERGKKGEGRGGEGKEERGSPGKLLYTDHFSIEEQTPLARCETEALV